jgi:hypothetical protein
MVERAKALKSTKPPQGLHFSLQQQGIVIIKIAIFLKISQKSQNIRENKKVNILLSNVFLKLF